MPALAGTIRFGPG